MIKNIIEMPMFLALKRLLYDIVRRFKIKLIFIPFTQQLYSKKLTIINLKNMLKYKKRCRTAIHTSLIKRYYNKRQFVAITKQTYLIYSITSILKLYVNFNTYIHFISINNLNKSDFLLYYLFK